MSINFMVGFKEFANNDYLSTIKKQLNIPKKIWIGMPLLLTNVKLGKQMISKPTTFYVSSYDDNSVTLTTNQSNEEDPDGEIDMDKSTIKGRFEVTISKKDYENLHMPQTFQGLDPMSLRPPGAGF